MSTWTGWQSQLLRALGVPTTKQNLQFLTAWQGHEGGAASFNPLNTTQGAQGATDYNSVHVRNYPNQQIGLNATVQTLRNGYYPAILAALRSGNPGWSSELGKNLSTWGTGSAWMGGYRSTPDSQLGGAAAGPSSPAAAAPVQQGQGVQRSIRASLASGKPIDFLALARTAMQQNQAAAGRTPVRTSATSPGASQSLPGGVAGGLASPFAAGWKFARVDQGVDYTTGGNINAPAAGVVTRVGAGFHGGTGQAIFVKFDRPVTIGGHVYDGFYSAETNPLLHPGVRVKPGTAISTGGSGEIGFTIGGRPARLVGGLGAGTRPTQAGQDLLSAIRR